jgi:hypothetical protein
MRRPWTALAAWEFVTALLASPGLALRSLLRTPDEAEKFALLISNLARQVAVLERYERRALSRRRKAFRSLDIAQRKSNFSKEWTEN